MMLTWVPSTAPPHSGNPQYLNPCIHCVHFLKFLLTRCCNPMWWHVFSKGTGDLVCGLYCTSSRHSPIPNKCARKRYSRSLASREELICDTLFNNYWQSEPRTKTVGQAAFRSYVRCLWNDWPAELRKSETVKAFKKKKGTYFFSVPLLID